jgi:hypothetical protein
MSSGFVSGGTVDNPTERDDEWRKAQVELEAARKAKADLAAQHDGKSLFEILQANKDKKQAEFEERARYKLHVGLDDDEADYLDSIEEKKRKEEANVKKDTRDQLDAFRRQQEEAERKEFEEEDTNVANENVQWAAPGRKRKKGLETSLLKGVKLKKTNSTTQDYATAGDSALQDSKVRVPFTTTVFTDHPEKSAEPPGVSLNTAHTAPLAKIPIAPLLGMGYASSDED